MVETADRYQLAAVVHGLGRRQARQVLATTGSVRDAYRSLPRRPLTADAIARACRRHQLSLLLPADPGFPGLLCGIADPPPLLYARGDPAALLQPTVAIVGARRCTRTGADVAADLAAALAQRGITVVSGLARGIDTAAHRAALDHGLTVAVIGSGLANPYPAGNRGLARAMVAGGGLLLSEYPPAATARPHHFPERNRLISGLARGVVVVEAGEHSGSLITARLALEQGREVCAVPGSVANPAARGCHRLLRDGAALVEHADDVLQALGLVASPGLVAPAANKAPAADKAPAANRWPAANKAPAANQAPAAGGAAADHAPAMAGNPRLADGLAAILATVEPSLTTLDQVIAGTGLSAPAASAALVELELGGFVRQVPGGYIRRPFR